MTIMLHLWLRDFFFIQLHVGVLAYLRNPTVYLRIRHVWLRRWRTKSWWNNVTFVLGEPCLQGFDPAPSVAEC